MALNARAFLSLMEPTVRDLSHFTVLFWRTEVEFAKGNPEGMAP